MLLQILGSLGVFLFGMKLMSDGLQKSAGQKLQSILNFMTQNRVMGVMTGFLVTSVIQSSSATTVMVVSFVNAGLLTLTQAISTIMGANIGTTITTWIVSWLGFKMDIQLVALPIVGIGMPFMFSKHKKNRDFGDFLIGFGLLFIGLGMLKSCVPDITQYPGTQEYLSGLASHGVWSYLLYVAAGTILTMIIQSSSAMMTVTVAMAYKGWLDLPSAAALCLGENIGTTITAYLAALGTNVTARRAARAHTMFNVIGVIWMSFVFRHFLTIESHIVPWDWNQRVNFPLNLALFHTLFNTLNTLLLIWFVPQIAAMVQWMVKPSSRDKDKSYKLQYISAPLQDTGNLNIIEAKREIEKMATLVIDMFDDTMSVFSHPDKKLEDKLEKIKDTESLTDQMQVEITRYMQQCARENISENSYQTLNGLMRVVHELESIADSNYNLSEAVRIIHEKKLSFDAEAVKDLNELSKLTKSFLVSLCSNITTNIDANVLNEAYKLEEIINKLRHEMNRQARHRMQKGADVRSELLFMDIVKFLEHIGDNSLNVMQALNQIPAA